jgi:hypothetical protein
MANSKKSLSKLEQEYNRINQSSVRDVKDAAEKLKALDRITNEMQRQNKLMSEQLDDVKDYDNVLKSIAGKVGKNNNFYKENNKILNQTKIQMNGIASILKTSTALTNEQKDAAYKVAGGYKDSVYSVTKILDSLIPVKKNNNEIRDVIQQQIEEQKAFIKTIDTTTEDGKDLKKVLEAQLEVLEKMGPAAQAAAQDMQAMGDAGEMLSNTGFGKGLDKFLSVTKKFRGGKGAGSIGEVVGNLQSKRGAAGMLGQAGKGMVGMLGGVAKFLGPIGLATGAIMAAASFFNSGQAAKTAVRMAALTGGNLDEAGKDAMKGSKEYRDIITEFNYGLPRQLQRQAAEDNFEYNKGLANDSLQYDQSLVKDKINYENSLLKDQIQFRQNQESQTLDANNAQRKALFTSDMGRFKSAISVSERALQAIGSSTQAVLDTVKNVGVSLSAGLSSQVKLATAAAGLATQYMSSADDVLSMSNTFRLMDKSSAETGTNMAAGVGAFAKLNDMSPAQLFKQMADSQQEIFKYSNFTTSQFATQAVLLSKMNTSMSSMSKASDSMVLNYKDSIKSEMSLSAMLGKNVNLSEVRARLMSGDMAGGASALKTALGGVDIGSMNAFQKQALSQATGMDVNELMNLTQSKGGGVTGTIAEKNAIKTGKDIANGALQQDIANEASKLKLEQKFRKENLDFEQKERLQMLGVEQQMRLQGIALEQSFRIKSATLKAEQDIKDLQNKYVKEVMSEQIISGLSSQYKNTLDVNKVTTKTQGVGVTPMGGISYTNLADSTKKGGEPTVAAINTNNKLQEVKLTQQMAKQTRLLSESEYSVKLQQEMVAMLGLSTQMLGKIMDNTANGTDVTLDGKSLRQSLLNQARRNYGVARTT